MEPIAENIVPEQKQRPWGLLLIGGTIAILSLLSVTLGAFSKGSVAGVSGVAGNPANVEAVSSFAPSPAPSLEPLPSASPIPAATPTPTPTAAPKALKASPTIKPTVRPTETPKPVTTSKATPVPTGEPSAKVSGGDKNCDDFSGHAEAQNYFEANGGSPSNNVDDLDRDHDGQACE